MSLFGGIELPGHPSPDNVRRLDVMIIPQIRLMERKGIAIDLTKLAQLSSELGTKKDALRKEIINYIPPDKLEYFVNADSGDEDAEIDINLNSAPQIRKLLFEHLGIGRGKRLKTTKKGDLISTGKKQMETLKREHPVIPLILRYRECSKLKSTYTDSLPRLARLHNRGDCRICGFRHVQDHYRIHTTLLTTRTDTGRLASKRPNLQNIPARTAEGRMVRECFIAEPGKWLIGYDYAQIELRLMAHAAQETNMMRIFRDGGDIHTDTAMRAFDLPEDRIDKMLHRAPCKNVNFGICIAEGQRVLTDSGLKPIQDVSCWDRVWDGNEFVFHSGVEFNGYREVTTHDGLTATPDHKVWVEGGRKVELSEALAEGLRLVVTGVEGRPVRYVESDRKSVARWSLPKGCRALLALSCEANKIGRQSTGGQKSNVCVSKGQVFRQEIFATCRSIPCYCSTLHEPTERKLPQLWGSRNSESVQVGRRFRELRTGALTPLDLQTLRHRPQGQRWSLREGESEIGNTIPESPQPKTKVVRVYDILNAGPQRRFTCEGKLVSNCYGLGPQGLYDLMALTYAQAGATLPDYIDEGWCGAFIDKWFDLYPSAAEYFDLQHYRARRYGITWCMFGGVRRCPEVRSQHERVVQAGLRQAGNNPIQRGAAGVMKLGMARVQALFDRLDRDHQIHVDPLLPIHDELLSECDEEWADEVGIMQGFEMAEALRDIETGEYHCRVPITTDGHTMECWTK